MAMACWRLCCLRIEMSASQHTWAAAGCPAHGYIEEPCETVCATCGTSIETGVHLVRIETPTTANHGDYFRFGARHVCPACAWLYAAGKGKPGNYIATPGRMEYTVISVESVVTDKRPWIEVLKDVAALPASSPAAGVMTTDVKPRLWPRVRLSTVGRFGLYIHAPDHDVSEWREFNLAACLEAIETMLPPLAAGYSKASIHSGLLHDFARFRRAPSQAMTWEADLSAHRGQAHFLPALIAAGVRKERKHDDNATARPAANPRSAATSGDRSDQARPGLF